MPIHVCVRVCMCVFMCVHVCECLRVHMGVCVRFAAIKLSLESWVYKLSCGIFNLTTDQTLKKSIFSSVKKVQSENEFDYEQLWRKRPRHRERLGSRQRRRYAHRCSQRLGSFHSKTLRFLWVYQISSSGSLISRLQRIPLHLPVRNFFGFSHLLHHGL